MKDPELKRCVDLIFYGQRSDEEWIKLKERTERALEKASDSDKKEYEESGAGDMLMDVIMSL